MSPDTDQPQEGQRTTDPADRASMVDGLVEQAMSHVVAHRDTQPFRAIPTWEDLHGAIEAALRFLFSGGRPQVADDPPPDAPDKTDPPQSAA